MYPTRLPTTQESQLLPPLEPRFPRCVGESVSQNGLVIFEHLSPSFVWPTAAMAAGTAIKRKTASKTARRKAIPTMVANQANATGVWLAPAPTTKKAVTLPAMSDNTPSASAPWVPAKDKN